MSAVVRILIDGVDRSDAAFRQARQNILDLDRAAQQGGRGFSALGEIATGALRMIGEMAVTAAVSGMQSLASFVQQSVDVAGTFQKSVLGLQAVAGGELAKAGITFDQVREKALQLGADTQFSAQQAIEAMTALAKGGVSVTAIMGDATDATLNLAAAAGVDLAAAAEIVAKQLGIWGNTGVTAQDVTELLAAAANASTVDVHELALGLANAGGSAKVAGVSFEELVTTLGLIAPYFQSASDAGTSLKTFIARLVPQTKEQTRAMIELGLATKDGASLFFDATGSFIGMEKAAKLLHNAIAPLSQEQRIVALQTIFGSDAIRAAAAIADAGAEGFLTFAQAMIDTGGAATAAAIMQQGYSFQMEQLSGSIETLQIRLGSIFLPLMTRVLEILTAGVNDIGAFVDRFKNIPEAIITSDDPIRTFIASLSLMFPQIGAVTDALWTWYAALKESGPASDAFISAVVSTLANGANAIATQLESWVSLFGAWILQSLPGLGTNLATFAQTLLSNIAAVTPGLIERLASWGDAFVRWLIAVIPLLFGELTTLSAQMIAWIVAQTPNIIAQLAEWGKRFLAWLIEIAPLLLAMLQTLGQQIIAWLSSVIPLLVAQFAEWGRRFVAWLIEISPVLLSMLQTLGQQVLVWVAAQIPGIVAQFAEWGRQFVAWLPGAQSSMMALLGALAQQVLSWIGQAAASAGSAAVGIGRSIVDGIASGISSAVGAAISAAEGAVRAAIDAAWRAASGAGGGGAAQSAPARASGGPVMGGVPILVGEHGPELFVPATSGRVMTTSHTINNYFSYTPTYGSAPSSPLEDFALLQALARAAS